MPGLILKVEFKSFKSLNSTFQPNFLQILMDNGLISYPKVSYPDFLKKLRRDGTLKPISTKFLPDSIKAFLKAFFSSS